MREAQVADDEAAGAGHAGNGENTELQQLRARVAALESEGVRPPRHRVRSFFAAVLITLGVLLAPLSIVAAWASDVVGDTDRYVETVAPLASEPAVQEAVANRVTNAVMTRLDLSTLLSDAAPAERPRLEKALGKLGDSLEGAVESFVRDKARAIVASEQFETVWTEANRRAHAAVDKALTGSGGGAIELQDNAVTLNLGPVIDQVKERLVADGMTVAGRIPQVNTNFVLVKSDQLEDVRTYVRILQLAGDWLVVLAVVLLAAGVLLAVRRRRALVTASLCAAAAVIVLAIGLRVFRAVYLDRLPAQVSQDAAAEVYDTVIHLLQLMIRMTVALAVVIALAAWLTGPGRRASFLRGLWTSGIGALRGTADRAGLRLGPVGPFVRRFRTWINWIVVAGALVIYLLWSYPTGWTVVGIALCLVFVLAIVEFLAGPAEAEQPQQPQPPATAPV
ncbi:hypothetical protein ABZO31_02690 [Streptomyces sp. HUAS MG47]|uniref:hypothetical protein n=1 Tax=Streptomyces solicamelliae TaxID=3231716 RepID=UPI003877B10D